MSMGFSRSVDKNRPYSALASVYDLVMDYVDYHEWAEYVKSLVCEYDIDASRVLELGCGTGSLAFELEEMLPACSYLATDGSPEMVRVASEKARILGSAVDFELVDFMAIPFAPDVAYPLVLLLYDGINYLLTSSEVTRALIGMRALLGEDGCFIFDQSTPANSVNNADFFEDSGSDDVASYVRESRYDATTSLHHTSFRIRIDDEDYEEHHVQRAYTKEQMEECLAAAGLRVIAALDGLSHSPASAHAERIHWIVRPA